GVQNMIATLRIIIAFMNGEWRLAFELGKGIVERWAEDIERAFFGWIDRSLSHYQKLAAFFGASGVAADLQSLRNSIVGPPGVAGGLSEMEQALMDAKKETDELSTAAEEAAAAAAAEAAAAAAAAAAAEGLG